MVQIPEECFIFFFVSPVFALVRDTTDEAPSLRHSQPLGCCLRMRLLPQENLKQPSDATEIAKVEASKKDKYRSQNPPLSWFYLVHTVMEAMRCANLSATGGNTQTATR